MLYLHVKDVQNATQIKCISMKLCCTTEHEQEWLCMLHCGSCECTSVVGVSHPSHYSCLWICFRLCHVSAFTSVLWKSLGCFSHPPHTHTGTHRGEAVKIPGNLPLSRISWAEWMSESAAVSRLWAHALDHTLEWMWHECHITMYMGTNEYALSKTQKNINMHSLTQTQIYTDTHV